jgi:hypothetical protein
MTTAAQQQQDEQLLRGVIGKLEETRQTNMVRNAFAQWAVEDLLHQKSKSSGTKKGFIRRRLSVFGQRNSKNKKADKAKKAALQLDDDIESNEEELDRESASNPFSGDTEKDGMPEDIRDIQALDDNDGAAEDEESEQTAGDAQTEEEGTKKGRVGIGGSIRTKLKARSERKIHRKADKKTNKALARAEKQEKKWKAQVAKEESEAATEAHERQKAFMAKAASRSKDLMLQHLCAIAIQSAWRSASVRNHVNASGIDREREILSPASEKAIDSSSIGLTMGNTPARNHDAGVSKEEEKKPAKIANLISPGLMQLVESQPALSP